MATVSELSHRVGALLRTRTNVEASAHDEIVAECMTLCSEIADHLDDYRAGDLMIDTLRGWIGKCQRHVGLEQPDRGQLPRLIAS